MKDVSQEPFVSVVMSSFNHARYLWEAVESVLKQTYRHFELIVVDDGSWDASLGLLKEWALRHPGQIRLFTHPDGKNYGIQKTVQLGISKTRGDIIAFLESDDRWTPDHLERVVRAFQKSPETGVVFNHYKPFGDTPAVFYWRLYAFMNKITIQKEKPFRITRLLLKRNPVASFSHFAVRRGLADALPEMKSPAASNYDWWLLAHLSVRAPFYFVPEVLSEWRIHSKSAAFGGVSFRSIWRLQRFLSRMTQSIQEYRLASDSDPVTDRDFFEPSVSASARFHSLIERRNWLAVAGASFLHPALSFRFLAFILLRNLMFQTKAQDR